MDRLKMAPPAVVLAPKRPSWGDLRSAVRPLNGDGRVGGVYDPSFTGNRSVPFHRWVPWVAGYSAQFVDDALTSYNGHGRRSRVLDPFAGVGTTLVQAHMRGCDAVGFELNPYAALVTRVKLAAGIDLSSDALSDAGVQYREFVRLHRTPERRPPVGFTSHIPFFSPSIERKILVALDFIDTIDDPWVRDAFRVALGAVLISVSNYTYEPSLGSRPGAGKPLVDQADVVGILSAKVTQISGDISHLEVAPVLAGTERTVHARTFLDYSVVERRPCDIAITSPPYLNNYHYLRNTRPHLWWLGLVDGRDDTRRIENESMGKYWQTVRKSDPVELTFAHPGLKRLLGRIREVRRRENEYGGAGWANYAATYFNDTRRYLSVLHRALKPGGVAAIVIGNSIIQGVGVATDRFLAEIAEGVGFEHLTTDRLRDSRVGGSILRSSVRRGRRPKSGAGLYESAVILRRFV